MERDRPAALGHRHGQHHATLVVMAERRRVRQKVADAIEAIIAAIYRDGGMEAARAFISRHWIMELVEREISQQNPKTRLSDWCGANRAPYATYDIIERSGPDHEPVFLVEAKVEGRGSARDKGRSRQEAEMAAADRLLRDLIRNAG